MRLEVFCPAKINLFLSVGPRDRRGYHPLRTILQAIELHDTLTINTGASAPSFECSDPSVPADNTVVRALRLSGEVANIPPLAISLVKRIPSQSGLGGGSSDAAGLLRAIKRVLPGRLPDSEAAAIALAVGADVPFFLIGGRARGEGYGERLSPLPELRHQWLAVARPPIGCDTPSAYERLDACEHEWREFPESDELYNDFERVAPRECLELIERLKSIGARDAGLTGSGSAVFGRFSNEAATRKAVESLSSEEGVTAWATRTLSRPESLDIRQTS